MTSARQDILAAQLRTAMTKAERRNAVKQFQTPEARGDRAALNAELRAFLLSQREETRAAGEGTNSAGGYIAPPGFSDEIVRLLKDYDGIISDVEDLPTVHGQTWKRPQVSSLVVSGSALSENTAATDATSTLVSFPGQQSFGITPTYVALLSASLQLIQDAFHQDISDGKAGAWNPLVPGAGNQSAAGSMPPVYNGVPTGNGDLVDLLASAAAEAIGRQVAAAGSTALYGAATAGQEVALGTLTAANLAKLVGLVDPAYLRMGCAYYMSAADFATVFSASTGILANADGLRLNGWPIVITNAATNWVTSTVSGPVFGRLDRFMSMRRVKDVQAQVLRERYADNLQVAINTYFRADFQPRGETTAVAFSK